MRGTVRVAPGGMILHVLDSGVACRALALESSLASAASGSGRRTAGTVSVADSSDGGLGGARQSGAEHEGHGGTPGFRDSRTSVWWRGLAETDDQAAWAGVALPSTRPTEEGGSQCPQVST